MKKIKTSSRFSLIAVFIITMMLMAAFLPGTLQAGTSTGIWTTNSDGSAQNLMQYDFWEDVYVQGGNLAAESYYIRVTNTSGSDIIAESSTAVIHTGSGEFGPEQLPSLLPDFSLEAGIYKVWICPDNGFAPSDSKTDNFTVNYSGSSEDYTANLTIEKTFDEDVDWPTGGFQFELTDPTGATQTLDITADNNPLVFNDIQPGEYILEELSLPSDWSFEDFDITGAENVSEDTDNRTITFTIPEPAGADVDVAVTIENEYYDNGEYEATLTIIKEIDPEDAGIPGNGFLLSIFEEEDYPTDAYFAGMITSAGTYINQMSVSPSTMYIITEDIPAGWEKSFSVEGTGICEGDGWDVDDNGNLQVWIADNSFRDVSVVVTITNTYEEENSGNEVTISKFLKEGSDPSTQDSFEVELLKWNEQNSEWDLYDSGNAFDNPINLYIGLNNQVTLYDLPLGDYKIVENDSHFVDFYFDGQYTDTCEFTIDTTTGINGESAGDDGIQTIGVYIYNQFNEDEPDNPELIVKKRIGSGTSTQKYYTAELQKWECPYLQTSALVAADETIVGECGWVTVDSFEIAVSEPWSKTLSDLYKEYGYGEFRVIETGTDEISNWKSLSYAVDDETVDEAGFWVYGEENDDIVVVVTNNFKSGGGGDSDTWPQLTIEKEIGEGTATQDTFTVELQKLVDEDWSTVATFNIAPDNSKTVYMKQYGAGTYRVVEITDGIDNFDSVSYSVSGDTTGDEYQFKVVKNGRNSEVLVTNNFEDEEEEEEVIIEETEPAEPIIVPEPAPELPKTGAAPIAAGLGLILAAGGLAIRRIKK